MKFRVTTIELCVIGLIAIAIAWFASFIGTLPKPNGPRGELIPTSTPVERNRVFHSQGFSIIAPENWDRLPFGETGTPVYLQIAARGTPGKRLKSMITVTYLGESFDETVAKKLEQSIFQGQDSWEICRVTKSYTFDDGARSEFDLFFKREQNWWHIHFLIADEITSLPSSIRQYLESFRGQTGQEAANI
jgi:hypothetical protein